MVEIKNMGFPNLFVHLNHFLRDGSMKFKKPLTLEFGNPGFMTISFGPKEN